MKNFKIIRCDSKYILTFSLNIPLCNLKQLEKGSFYIFMLLQNLKIDDIDSDYGLSDWFISFFFFTLFAF